jgi:Domain of unknown function (DUF4037)
MTSMTSLLSSGVTLARHYYHDVVAPLLAIRWPSLPHAAARLGSGSDVLGLDDDTSRDHDWGLRLTLLVPSASVDDVTEHLEKTLPDTYANLPTRFATTWDPVVRQRVEVATVESFVTSRLGLDASATLDAVDWLCLTGQSLLEVTAGPVFTDTAGTLTRLRQKLSWYPEDVWRYVLATDWIRLGEDLPLMGRAGHRGDELGSRVLAGRITHTAMHLAFMLTRRWPPYPKWLGTMLTQLPVADELVPALTAVVSADDWQQRQGAMRDVLAALHQAQHGAGLSTPPDGVSEPFFDRPFLGIRAETVTRLLDNVTDPLVSRLPAGIGAVEQWVDNVKVLTDPTRRVQLSRHQFSAHTETP